MSPRQRTPAVLAGGLLFLAALGAAAAFRSCATPAPRSPDALRSAVRQRQGIPEAPPQAPPESGGRPLARLLGHVIDDLSGSKVPGIVLHAARDGAFVADGVSDASGAFRLDLPEGAYALRAFQVQDDGTSVTPLTEADVELRGAETRRDLHVRLFPFVVVEGVVLGPQGAPVPGAKVLVHFADPWKPEWNDKAAFAPFRNALRLDAVSGEDGGFVLQGALYPARYWLHASHPAFVPFHGEAAGLGFTVVPGHGQRQRFTIRLRPEDFTLLKGRVVSREGTPVPNASVTVRNGSLQHAVRTGADGSFSSNVRPEPVAVTVRHPDYRRGHRDLGVLPPKADPAAAPHDVELVLERKALRVVVSAADESGRPVDTPLILSEMDPSVSDLNPSFEVAVVRGAGRFHADPDIRHHVSLPADSPYSLVSVAPAGAPPAPDFLLSFQKPESEVRIVLARR